MDERAVVKGAQCFVPSRQKRNFTSQHIASAFWHSQFYSADRVFHKMRALLPCTLALLIALLGHQKAMLAQDDNCYVNDSGFTCCNKNLEAAMKSAMSGKDLLSSADHIQKMAESALGGKFETVVAFDDFAHKSHFKDGKSCKVEKDGQYALAWQP